MSFGPARLAPALAGAVLVTLLLMAPAATHPAEATFPGYNGKLVYENHSPPGEKIVVINPTGTSREELTGGAARDLAPVWSPDGEKIAFSRGVNPSAIYLMNPDGSGVTLLSQGADNIDDYTPAWAPDGSKIAFASYRTGDSDIWIMNPDGTTATNLTNFNGIDSDPSWSPDGTQIAFVSERDGDFEIYIMDADGGNQTRLTNSPGVDARPKWSADGETIYWSNANGVISAMNPNGTNQRQIVGDGAREPAPSPDGTLIAFHRGDGLYTMKPDGTHVVHVPGTDHGDYRPDWQPLAQAPVIVGDADCDGDADAVDALHVLRNVAGLPANANCLANANVKCDDGMTAVDALLILRYVAQLAVNLPPACPAVGSILSP